MLEFRHRMDEAEPDWKISFIISKVNQYYFTGTMQDGMLVIMRDGGAIYWVRQSFERARDESLFTDIRSMASYREAAAAYCGRDANSSSGTDGGNGNGDGISPGSFPAVVHLEMEFVTISTLKRLQKYFPFSDAASLDRQVLAARSVKSPYELEIITRAGAAHKRVFEELLPTLLEEGISEADFGVRLYALMMENGHQGLSRFAMTDTEMVLGQIGFGESSIYPGYFNGPGGYYGMSPAVPLLGSRSHRLVGGSLVFVDAAFGLDGYHTDKTVIFVYGGEMPPEAAAIHRKCINIQDEIASMLVPGAVPSQIYRSIMERLEPEFLRDFMGFGRRRAKFLGHGIGLQVDEFPVLAEGFDEPIEENMVIAVEPKKGIAGFGMVGIANTHQVTCSGGRLLT